MVQSRSWNSITFVIIDFSTIDHFLSNKDEFSIYIKYKNGFKTKIREKIATHNYGNIELKMSDYQGNINILTVINISWAAELNHNLWYTIPLTKKDVNVFLSEAGWLSGITINEKVFSLANIIENQYVVQLIKILKPAKVKWVIALTIKT